MLNWKQTKRKQNKTKTENRKCRVQRTVYFQPTLHWQQSCGFWLEARSISGYVVVVDLFSIFLYRHLLFIKICFPPATTLIHCIVPLYLLTVLTATRHYLSIDLFSFCFSNVDHVMFSREFAFCLFINHAFHFQVNTRAKDDIWKKQLWS